MIKLDGQIILLTGASRGIGAASGRVLLEAGANLVLHYNSGEGETSALVEEFGTDRAVAIQADLSARGAADDLWKQALAFKGHLTGLANNAAVMLSVSPEDGDQEWATAWETTMAVNVQAMADLCRHAILHFKEKGGGVIVNLSSRAAFRGDLPDSFHYAASKGAVVALTRSIAKGYAKDNIMAYNIAPGWVMTERVRPKLEASGNEYMMDEVPMGAPAPPAEVGNIMAFLFSGLAKNATGATIDINGASYFH